MMPVFFSVYWYNKLTAMVMLYGEIAYDFKMCAVMPKTTSKLRRLRRE